MSTTPITISDPVAVSPTPVDEPTVTRGETSSRIGWRIGAASLVIGAATNTAQAAMSQVLGGRPETIADQVRLANEHPTLLTAMTVVGTVAIPFMAVGFLAAAQELRSRAPRAGLAASSLLVLGMWGFLAIQISGLLSTIALRDPDGRAAAAFLDDLGSDPLLAVLFGLPFMVGCVVGMLTLTIGMLVKGGVPRWIPGLWLLFIVWDFTIGAVGPVDPHWLYLAGAVGLAAHLVRRSTAARAGA